MTNDDNLRERVLKKKAAVQHAIRFDAEKREQFEKHYREYLDRLITASGIFAGVTGALLASSIMQVKILTEIGLLFQVLCVIFVFYAFKSGLVLSGKLIRYVMGIDKKFSDFHYKLTTFLRGDIDADALKTEWDKFDSDYPQVRDNATFSEIEKEEEKSFSKLDSPWHEMNIAFWLFALGLGMVLLSVIFPYFLK
jgi:hypothetical protein